MESVDLHAVSHGQGLPVLVLHGAGVDHRESEACFEPLLDRPDLRRIYPDLPGMGRSPAPESIRSPDDVLHVLLDFAQRECGQRFLLVGHSWGAFLAQAMAARVPDQVAGLALVCPLSTSGEELPAHRVIEGSGDLGDAVFRDYFVIQTPEMLERYERFVAPSAGLVDEAAMERISENWGLSSAAPPYPGPTLVVAGRLDSTVGYAGAAALLEIHPRATLAVLDDAGHALPHEQPAVLGALMTHWLARATAEVG